MKKYWPYILVVICAIAFWLQESFFANKEDNLNDQIAKRDSIISLEKYKTSELKKKIKTDSIAYENEKQHIKNLRERYPDNVILDSLFRAGQNID